MLGYVNEYLYRYTQTGIEEPNEGGAVPKWTRTRQYLISKQPRVSERSKEAHGYSDNITWFMIVDNTSDFKIGDRLGTEDAQLYEVTSVKTYLTNQQIEAREIETEG